MHPDTGPLPHAGEKTTDGLPPGPGAGEALDALVDRTVGLQPWRRIFHLAGGLVIAVAAHQLGPASPWTPSLLAAALAIGVTLDVVRLRRPDVNRWFFRSFGVLASPREAGQVASSTWYVGGVLLVSLLLPPAVLVPAVVVLAAADPSASVVGRLWGRRRLGKGTVLGCLTFFVVAVAVLVPFVPLPRAVAVGLATAALEALPLGLDDNLVVPLAVGIGLTLMG